MWLLLHMWFRRLGEGLSLLALALIYLVLALPVRHVLRRMQRDPPAGWLIRSPAEPTVDGARRQF